MNWRQHRKLRQMAGDDLRKRVAATGSDKFLDTAARAALDRILSDRRRDIKL